MEMFMFENTKKKWSSVYPMLEIEEDKEKYQKFMRAALKKFGVESPAELSKEKKKEFFNYVDKNYIGDHEKDDPEAESVKEGELPPALAKAIAKKKNGNGDDDEDEEDDDEDKEQDENLANFKGKKAKPFKKEAVEEVLEIGTDKYAEYCKKLTPGQSDSIKQNPDNKRNAPTNGLDEKAVSQQQQKLMGLAYAVKKGEMSAPSADVQKIADSMSIEELRKMAEGKHKDLPVKKEDDVKEKTKTVKEVNFNKLDGRRKEFKEKVRKLYYEKIRKEQEAVTAEAKKEETKKPNKISINPDLKEYKGYDLAKKFFIKNEQPEFTEEEQNILKTIKESEVATAKDFAGTDNPMSGEQSLNLDAQPASVTSIAKAWKMSPMRVQEILDKMIRMGTVTRIGDAYSAGSVEVAN